MTLAEVAAKIRREVLDTDSFTERYRMVRERVEALVMKWESDRGVDFGAMSSRDAARRLCEILEGK